MEIQPAPSPISAMPGPGANPALPKADALAPDTKPPELAKDNDPGEFARRFADLTKQARKVRDEQKAIAEERKRIAEVEKELEEYRQVKGKAKENPIEYLKSLGLTYQDITEIMLNDNKLTPEQQIRLLNEKLDSQAKSREDDKKAQDEAKAKEEAAANEQAVMEFKQSIRSHIEAKADQYELIAAQDAHDLVFEVIEQFWREHDSLPDMEVACRHVEGYLEDEARKIMRLRKFAGNGENPPAEGTNGKSQPQSFTLTNQGTAAPAQTRADYLPDSESIARAASLLRWN